MDSRKPWPDWSLTEIENHVDSLVAMEPDLPADRKVLADLFSFIDYTTLEGSDNKSRIDLFCSKAVSFSREGIPSPAAVCVYPGFVRQARELLAGTGIRVAAVSGYFPSGQAPLDMKLREVKYALDEGADEVDFVINRGRLLDGDSRYVFDEITGAKEILGNIHLKVILETGELRTTENIRKASTLAIEAGADVIKTSTGKFQPAASEHAAFIMLNTIREHFLLTGIRIGFKPAGGIAEAMQAFRYYLLVKDILGRDWLTKELFRIGASRLADNIAENLLPR
jgi:deoxyribose-phosphate aldolase